MSQSRSFFETIQLMISLTKGSTVEQFVENDDRPAVTQLEATPTTKVAKQSHVAYSEKSAHAGQDTLLSMLFWLRPILQIWMIKQLSM